MPTTIDFLGAAETVTGSRYLVTEGSSRVLVDCGLFQGWKRLRQRNWRPPTFDPRGLDAVVLTHAHIDHSGYLPRLRQLGFTGPVFCTPGTRDLLKILWPDAGYLQEEQARHANRHGWSQHRPAAPLYTKADAIAALDALRPVHFDQNVDIGKKFSARFSRAGHILGAASVHLRTTSHSISFSGDVGRPHDPIMRAPDPLPQADTLVVESTYGDRRHRSDDVKEVLCQSIVETAARNGTVVIPAFAVGRAQHILHLLSVLRDEGRIPDLPTFLDSPMAINATDLYSRHERDHRLDAAACRRMCDVATYSRTADQSKAIDRRSGPMIIISASGMATGGRILHHLARFLPEEKNTVFIVGFQAAGTRGRSLVDGADEVKIHGDYVPVRAQTVQIDGLSAHADYREILDWLGRSDVAPRRVFVTHGEPSSADALRRRLHDEFGWDAVVPEDGSQWTLS